MKRFLIFADGRTGSSNLGKILQKLIGKVLFEPFNTKNKNKLNENSISLLMEEFKTQNYVGVKHISAQISHLFNLRLIDEFDKIIFLYRDNVLQQSISWEISSRTGIWYNKEKTMNDIHKAKNITYNEVLEQAGKIIGRREIYKGYFDDSNKLVIKYEDLYNGDLKE